MYSKIIFQSLTDLGLSQLESRLYFEFLNNPKLSITDVALNFGVHREKIYFAQDKLIEIGLASYPESGKKVVVTSPEKILTLIKQKKAHFSRSEKDFADILPDLLPLYHSDTQKPTVRIYEGEDQFLGLFDQFILEAKDEILCFINPDFFHSIVSIDYLNLWIRNRVTKNLKIRIISTFTNNERYHSDKDQKELREIRFLKPNDSFFKGAFYVSGNRITMWNPLLPKAISVQDRVIVETLKFMFEEVWNSLDDSAE
jgi:sugar-specific transcriptional regulator TrmB